MQQYDSSDNGSREGVLLERDFIDTASRFNTSPKPELLHTLLAPVLVNELIIPASTPTSPTSIERAFAEVVQTTVRLREESVPCANVSRGLLQYVRSLDSSELTYEREINDLEKLRIQQAVTNPFEQMINILENGDPSEDRQAQIDRVRVLNSLFQKRAGTPRLLEHSVRELVIDPRYRGIGIRAADILENISASEGAEFSTDGYRRLGLMYENFASGNQSWSQPELMESLRDPVQKSKQSLEKLATELQGLDQLYPSLIAMPLEDLVRLPLDQWAALRKQMETKQLAVPEVLNKFEDTLLQRLFTEAIQPGRERNSVVAALALQTIGRMSSPRSLPLLLDYQLHYGDLDINAVYISPNNEYSSVSQEAQRALDKVIRNNSYEAIGSAHIESVLIELVSSWKVQLRKRDEQLLSTESENTLFNEYTRNDLLLEYLPHLLARESLAFTKMVEDHLSHKLQLEKLKQSVANGQDPETALVAVTPNFIEQHQSLENVIIPLLTETVLSLVHKDSDSHAISDLLPIVTQVIENPQFNLSYKNLSTLNFLLQELRDSYTFSNGTTSGAVDQFRQSTMQTFLQFAERDDLPLESRYILLQAFAQNQVDYPRTTEDIRDLFINGNSGKEKSFQTRLALAAGLPTEDKARMFRGDSYEGRYAEALADLLIYRDVMYNDQQAREVMVDLYLTSADSESKEQILQMLYDRKSGLYARQLKTLQKTSVEADARLTAILESFHTRFLQTASSEKAKQIIELLTTRMTATYDQAILDLLASDIYNESITDEKKIVLYSTILFTMERLQKELEPEELQPHERAFPESFGMNPTPPALPEDQEAFIKTALDTLTQSMLESVRRVNAIDQFYSLQGLSLSARALGPEINTQMLALVHTLSIDEIVQKTNLSQKSVEKTLLTIEEAFHS